MPALAVDGGRPVRVRLLPYGHQIISEADIEAVVGTLRSEWLTTGPAVEIFERQFADAVGARHAVAVANGTAALHAAAFAAGVGPGRAAVTTPLTFADHFGQVLGRADLEGACLHTWVLRHQLDGVVQVPGFEHEDSAQLLFRLGIRAIGDGHLVVLPSQGGRVPSALERFPANKVTLLPSTSS